MENTSGVEHDWQRESNPLMWAYICSKCGSFSAGRDGKPPAKDKLIFWEDTGQVMNCGELIIFLTHQD